MATARSAMASARSLARRSFLDKNLESGWGYYESINDKESTGAWRSRDPCGVTNTLSYEAEFLYMSGISLTCEAPGCTHPIMPPERGGAYRNILVDIYIPPSLNGTCEDDVFLMGTTQEEAAMESDAGDYYTDAEECSSMWSFCMTRTIFTRIAGTVVNAAMGVWTWMKGVGAWFRRGFIELFVETYELPQVDESGKTAGSPGVACRAGFSRCIEPLPEGLSYQLSGGKGSNIASQVHPLDRNNLIVQANLGLYTLCIPIWKSVQPPGPTFEGWRGFTLMNRRRVQETAVSEPRPSLMSRMGLWWAKPETAPAVQEEPIRFFLDRVELIDHSC